VWNDRRRRVKYVRAICRKLFRAIGREWSRYALPLEIHFLGAPLKVVGRGGSRGRRAMGGGVGVPRAI
jgi:hypothetical protein